jgi:hypothetical protein
MRQVKELRNGFINVCRNNEHQDYLLGGAWSKVSFSEAN